MGLAPEDPHWLQPPPCQVGFRCGNDLVHGQEFSVLAIILLIEDPVDRDVFRTTRGRGAASYAARDPCVATMPLLA